MAVGGMNEEPVPVRLMFLDEWLHGEPRPVHGNGALGTAAGTESFPVLDPSKQIHTFMHQLTQNHNISKEHDDFFYRL